MSVTVLERPGQPGRPSSAAAGAERLLGQARRALAEASAMTDPADQYAAAHLAALRTAAALLTIRSAVAGSRKTRRPTSAWAQLERSAPELVEWTRRFASGAAKRAAALAGLPDAVTQDEAIDLWCDVRDFIGLAEARLGMLPLAAGDQIETRWASPLR